MSDRVMKMWIIRALSTDHRSRGIGRTSAPCLRRWLTLGLIIAAFAQSSSAQNYVFESGLRGGQITDAEWKTLPAYCIDTQGFKYGRNSSPNSTKWVALLGEEFWNLHHYCLGIVLFNRAQRMIYGPHDRKDMAESALGNFQYAVQRMPDGYVLAPELLTYLGRAHLLLDEPGKADADFASARKAKPDYWPAYSWWATYLATHGKTAEAREVVDQGLSKDPGSRTLQSMKRELEADTSKR